VTFLDDPRSATYQVFRVRKGKVSIRKIRHPDGSRPSADEEAEAIDEDHDVDMLVVIADFGEPIYPGLRRHGSVDRGGDKPAHVVIKGENHHMLEALVSRGSAHTRRAASACWQSVVLLRRGPMPCQRGAYSRGGYGTPG
jgi:hypothetical protein